MTTDKAPQGPVTEADLELLRDLEGDLRAFDAQGDHYFNVKNCSFDGNPKLRQQLLEVLYGLEALADELDAFVCDSEDLLAEEVAE